jgi:hypothetical protein
MIKRSDKSGQVTIFVIIAIIIVALAVLLYLFMPGVKSIFGTQSESPYTFFESCLTKDIISAVEKVSLSGGSISPEHYIVYNSDNIEYLCYTNEYYAPCVMQQPMLKNHIEEEISLEIKNKADECFDLMEKSFKDKGYTVNLRKASEETELLPKRIIFSSNTTLTLSKGKAEEYNKFKIVLDNNLYELVSIANSILNFEARYGDAETTTYMNYYKDLKVEKKKQIEGSTVYILTDTNSLNKFQFASRSYAWPPGYGLT